MKKSFEALVTPMMTRKTRFQQMAGRKGSTSPLMERLESRQLLSATLWPDNATADGNSPVVALYHRAMADEVVGIPTTTVVQGSPNPAALGELVALTATITSATGVPSGQVMFWDGPTFLGSGAVVGAGQATFYTSAFGHGTHEIVAEYTGDGEFAPSASTIFTQAIGPVATTLSLVSSATETTYGQSVTFTATMTAAIGTPAGSVLFGASSVALDANGVATFTTSAINAGTNNLTVTYQGNAYYQAATSPVVTLTVSPAESTTTLETSVTPTIVGRIAAFRATVSSAAGIPNGQVVFKEGATVLGTINVDTQGIAIFTTSSLAVGEHTIIAEYASNGNFVPSASSPLTQTIIPATTATSLTSSAASLPSGMALTLTATVTSLDGTATGQVTFMDGQTVLGHGTLNATHTATLVTKTLLPGTHSITAVYDGVTNFTTSTSDVLTQTITAQHTAPPTATVKAATATTKTAVYTFTITYTDPVKVKAATVSSNDVEVIGPNGFRQKAKLLLKSPNADATTITATYSIVPPGKQWSASANGTYAIWMGNKQVSDLAGNFITARKLKTFLVKLKK